MNTATGTTKQIEKLIKKWQKAKAKATAATTQEGAIRAELDLLLLNNNMENTKLVIGENELSVKRNKNYSIPKPGVILIKSAIKQDVFDTLFGVTYKIKPAVYSTLGKKTKKIVDQQLTIKDSPLTISLKQV